MLGEDKQAVLLASDAGYGFITRLADLQSKNRAGTAALKLPKGARVLPPVMVNDPEQSFAVSISNEGRLLVFPLSDLPVLARGKGNKMINIPSSRLQSREEFVVAVAVIRQGQQLVVHSGKRYLNMKMSDLEHYRGERGRRGNKLPRGFQKVDRVEVADS